MAEEYSYQKKRTDFGRHGVFEDSDQGSAAMVGLCNKEQTTVEYIQRNPNKITLDNIPQLSEHRVSYTF